MCLVAQRRITLQNILEDRQEKGQRLSSTGLCLSNSIEASESVFQNYVDTLVLPHMSVPFNAPWMVAA